MNPAMHPISKSYMVQLLHCKAVGSQLLHYAYILSGPKPISIWTPFSLRLLLSDSKGSSLVPNLRGFLPNFS